jgi:hypothetical protein
MKIYLLGIWFGIRDGARSGFIGAIIFLILHAISRAIIGNEDKGNILAQLVLQELPLGIILGTVIGIFIGFIVSFPLSLPKFTRYSLVAGVFLGGLIGLVLGRVYPFPVEIAIDPEKIVIQQYYLLPQLLGGLAGAWGGGLGGVHFRTSLLKKLSHQ